MKLHRFIFIVVLFTSHVSSAFEEPSFTVQGHRGARNIFPENTLPSFQYAMDVGVDYVELDIHVTKDNQLVIYHDPEVSPRVCQWMDGRKLTKKIAIYQMTYEQTQSFDCGRHQKNGYPINLVPGATIPSFDELIDLVEAHPNGTKTLYKVDIKSKENARFYPDQSKIAQLVLETVYRRGIQDKVVYSSFDEELLRQLRLQDATSRVALLTVISVGKSLVAKAQKLGAYAVSPHHKALELQGAKKHVKRLQALGFKVVPWTVNGMKNWQKMLDAGVDGLITDDPEGLLQHIAP